MPRILVVEDESIIAMDVEETLRGAGFQVVSIARSLREAVAVLSDRPADLMVVDLDTSELHLPLPWLGVPVVWLTSFDGSRHRDTLALAHRCACPHVMKPFLAPRLLAAVDCVLRLRSPGGPSRRELQDFTGAAMTNAEFCTLTGGRNGIGRNPKIPEDKSAHLVAS